MAADPRRGLVRPASMLAAFLPIEMDNGERSMSFTDTQANNASAGAGIAGFATNFSTGGTHLDDWSSKPAPWLNAIQTTASLGGSLAAFSSSAGPYGAIVGAGVGAICGSITDGIDAYDSQKTVAELKKIQKDDLPKVRDATQRGALAQVIAVALAKKTRHRDIAISQAATLGVSKMGTAMYRIGRAIHKKRTGTQGVSRDQAADTLIAYMKDPGPAGVVAKKIIQAVAKQNFDDLLKSSIKDSLRS
jgi:hypothetical protein